MLETALAAGVAAAGGHALLGGVLPTPGVSLLIRRYGLDLGAVVSASHNPFADNGIKFFGPDGTKLSDEEEARVEAVLAEPRQPPQPGRVRELHGAARRLPARARASLRGARPGRQAGAARLRERRHVPRRAGDLQAARRGRHGARGRARRAQHQRRLRLHARRVARRCDARRASTTSASRSTATATACSRWTGTGAVVDGDELIALAALHLRGAGRLPGDGVAVTVMTNYGFHQAMEREGISVATTPVGDRNVLVELLRRGWALGGEQSGPHHRHELRARRVTASRRRS